MADAFDMAAALAVGVEPDRATLAWLIRGFRRHHAGEDLTAALGLTLADRNRRRDRALREAAELLRTPEASDWDIAGLLEERLRRFQTGKLALCRRGLNGPLDEIDSLLFVACESGTRVCGSRKHLHRLL